MSLSDGRWPERTIARIQDIDPLNRLFADAFTDRYRRDGMVGVRVPQLNPLVWQYALEDAGAGAFLWRDADGSIVAFNIVHQSGAEGWMGPLAVRPDLQQGGLGKLIVQAAIDWLIERQVATLGLETMPRTVDNIGFYSTLGFDPGHLTLSMGRDVPRSAFRRSRSDDGRGYDDAGNAVAACRRALAALSPVHDFTREIEITLRLRAGDLTVVEDRGDVIAFALWHSAPLAVQRARDELRVLKVFAKDTTAFRILLERIEIAARAEGVRRVIFRAQGGLTGAYRVLIASGYRVRWSDLRMTYRGHPEPSLGEAIVYSNWEI